MRAPTLSASAFRLLSFALLTLSASGLALHGCSESGSGGSFAGASTAAPVASGAGVAPLTSGTLRLVFSAPAQGDTNASVSAALFLNFSADLDPASLSTISLHSDRGPVAAVTSLVTPRVVSIQPSAPLRTNTPHYVRVAFGVLDRAGQGLAHESVIRFRTTAVVPITGGSSTAPLGTSVAPPPLAPALPGVFQAGVAEEDLTPAGRVPLAGYGGGARRRIFPDLNPFNDYTFLNPATGVKDPVFAKALVLDNGHERVAIVTLDLIAVEAQAVAAAVLKASQRGFTVPLEKVLACASHTHSGPGATSQRLLWKVIAADRFRKGVFETLTDRIADALVRAEQGLGPVSVGVSTTQVRGVTQNRRAPSSPNLQPGDVDPELLVIRLDRPGGAPLATVWNFGIHGTHFGTANLEVSADIMGSASAKAEAAGSGMALFLNGCEGDVEPIGGYHTTGQVLADAILRARAQAVPAASGILQSTHEQVDLGRPVLSLSLQRHASPRLAQSGAIQGLARLGIRFGADIRLPRGWVAQEFRFQAIRIGKTVISSFPGEPIHEIGLAIKQRGKAQGFDHVVPAGLANGHGSYFATPREFAVGGYESLASFFGPTTGTKVLDVATRLVDRLKP